jgi:Zn-dependent oligopeptidase
MTKEEVKKKLIENIPDFVFFYSEENLEFAPQILEELLEEEKEDFYETLETKEEAISFETFNDFSYLDVYFSFLEHLDSVKSGEKIRKIIEDFEPKYIDFSNEVAYSKKYYSLLEYCLKNCQLDAEQKRIIEKAIEYYQKRGIHLDEEKQKRLKEINQELSKLSQDFEHNVMDDELEFSYFFENDSFFVEMPEDDKNIALERAKEKWKEWYFFDLSYSSYPLVLSYCSESEIRKHFYTTKNSIASQGKYDNRNILLNILKLRKEKATILDYDNYAEYSFSLKMAESPEKVKILMQEIQEKSFQKWKNEIQEIQKFFKLDEINAWDTSYYLRKYKKEKYGFEAKIFKKYFEFEAVLSWLWKIVKKLYNVDVIQIPWEKKVAYGNDIRIYEVKKEGKLLSYFLGDYFYREGKRWWAWENSLRDKFIQEDKNIIHLIANICSFQKNKTGKTLLSLSDVETMFHEFWHALHGIVWVSKYSELSHSWLEWDFVELPSQLMENWCSEFESLSEFAYHFETGEKIPKSIIDLMKESENFGSWIWLSRQTELSLLDLFFHIEDLPKDQEKFAQEIFTFYKKSPLFSREENYKPHTSFNHIFAGAYSAWFYSYMRAEIIEAQVFSEFKQQGMFDKKIAKKYFDTILSQGSKKDAKDLFYDCMGSDIDIGFYLKKYDIN